MSFQKLKKIFLNGIISENPTLRLLLGMCPTLAVSTAAIRGMSMGITTTLVLIFSNMAIASLRKLIPEQVRIPAFIVVIATFVSILEMLLKAFIPSLSESLGIYIPLIVVNCIIFARAEAFAFKNPVIPSMVDGLGMGLGFTLAITLLSSLREIIGNGTLFDMPFMPENYIPMTLVVRPAGGFMMLGILLLMVNGITGYMQKQRDAKAKEDLT